MPMPILFKDADYVGDHKHVFAAEPNLNASDDDGFNDAVSSLAILTGNWEFYANSGFQAPYKPVLGPGGLPFVANVGIKNDDMSSLQPVTASPNQRGLQLVQQGVILFENASFHGNHKHILMANGNLQLLDRQFLQRPDLVDRGLERRLDFLQGRHVPDLHGRASAGRISLCRCGRHRKRFAVISPASLKPRN